MYIRSGNSALLKHLDFTVLDLLMLQIAYVLSYIIRMNALANPYKNKLYLMISIVISLADIGIAFFTAPYRGILQRGYFIEFNSVLKQVFLVAVLEVFVLFLSQNGQAFSRVSLIWFIVIAVILIYLERISWKAYLRRHKSPFYERTKLLLLTTRENAESVIRSMMNSSFNELEIAGVAYIGDVPGSGESVCGIPVICRAEEVPDCFRTRWVDAVFVRTGDAGSIPPGILEKCVDMGITVHNCLDDIMDWTTGRQYINRVGGYNVVTTSVRVVPVGQLFIKRLIDIAGGLIGVVCTGIISVFLAPAILLSSPGPVFFTQIRIGKNGKRFRLYKFRSMYADAEERKKELLKNNEMNGLMFKMENDPRIIGSGPDGTRRGLGWFIRKTSLDEFPQFWNVLKGDMSLVGTRPPTEDEWARYKPYHRARLAVKPGLTGIWQVSGRSNVRDFEEVVKMDMEYVKKWDIGMDIKIMLKTVLVVLGGVGSK